MQRFRYIAPAGSPVGYSDLIHTLIQDLMGTDAIDSLNRSIEKRYNIHHSIAISSGRAAMTHILRALIGLNTDPERCEVVIPAYTCYSVPASVIVSGLKPRIVDIDQKTLTFRRDILESVDFSKVLCIVTANLYGYPNDLAYIEQLAKRKGCFMLDDAAQGLEAKIAGRYVGTYGDVGLYSFDKGKNITSLQGCVVVTNRDDIADAVRAQLDSLSSVGIAARLHFYISLTAYITLLRPWLYWIPARLPFTGLGRTPYTTDIPFYAYPQYAANLARRLFSRVERITDARRRKAQALLKLISCQASCQSITVLYDAEPVYLRLPILAPDRGSRDRWLAELNRQGIGATASYPRSVGDLDEVLLHGHVQGAALEGARFIADRIITLPTLHYMTDRDIDIVAQTLSGLEKVA